MPWYGGERERSRIQFSPNTFFFLIELVSGLKLSPGTRVFFPDCHALGRVDFLVSVTVLCDLAGHELPLGHSPEASYHLWLLKMASGGMVVDSLDLSG